MVPGLSANDRSSVPGEPEPARTLRVGENALEHCYLYGGDYVELGRQIAALDPTGPVRAGAQFGRGLVVQVLRGDLDAASEWFARAAASLGTSTPGSELLRSEIVRHQGFDALLRQGETRTGIGFLAQSLALRALHWMRRYGHAVTASPDAANRVMSGPFRSRGAAGRSSVHQPLHAPSERR